MPICDICHAECKTAQGLAGHRRLRHGTAQTLLEAEMPLSGRPLARQGGAHLLEPQPSVCYYCDNTIGGSFPISSTLEPEWWHGLLPPDPNPPVDVRAMLEAERRERRWESD